MKKMLLILLLMISNSLLADMGKIGVQVRPFDKTIKNSSLVIIMVTIFKDAHAIAQRETTISDYVIFSKLKPGNYNIRFEGDGIQAKEKHGILVFDSKTTETKTVLQFGEGTKTILYSTSK